MTFENLCYDVTPYQRNLWRYRKMVEPGLRDSERSGEERYEAFPSFAGEIFHRLYADEPKQLDEPAIGADVFSNKHDEIGKLPEFEDLRGQCLGNEEWAGVGTGAIIDTLLDQVDAPADQVEDPCSDINAEGMVKELLARANPEDKEAIEEAVAEIRGRIKEKTDAAKLAAAMTDPSQVRRAVRDGCKKAKEEIEERKRFISAFAGANQHDGRGARKDAGRKLAGMVKDNDRMKRIAELAGRLRRIALDQQSRKPRRGTEEVAGIELGADLSRIVPTEILYTEEGIEGVFARKLFEHSLVQLEMSKTPRKEQGPIVVLLDSSGSMRGNNADAWAAAVALAFLEIARKQKRAFAIVHFGSKVLWINQWAARVQMSIESIVEAVNFFAADGGTDFQGPLLEGIKIIKTQGGFEKADIVMVTDGYAAVSNDWLTRYKQKKEQLDFRCFSILVGGSTNVATSELFSDEVVLLDDALASDEAMHKFFKEV